MERVLRRGRVVVGLSVPEIPSTKRKRGQNAPPVASAGETAGDGISDDFFERIPDDLLIVVLSKLSSTASCPSDFINAMSSSKRFHALCLDNMVLSKACVKLLTVKEKKWSEAAHRFLWRCTLAGNLEACYVLGMIRFYCLGRVSGISLMAKAAIGLHAPALYSLAVIQFNGSGGSKKTKNLYAGVAFCARSASLGHLDALREFGYCLQDGYGVHQNVFEGRRCLIRAQCSEITGPEESYRVNRFMAEWFAKRLGKLAAEDLRLCSNTGCGRREMRRHEFRRCSMCGVVNYCSRVCQAMDWRISHKMKCTTWFIRRQLLVDIPGGGAVADADAVEEGAV